MPEMVTRLAIVGTLAMLLMAPWTTTIAQMPPIPFPMPPGSGPPMGPMLEGRCPPMDMLKNILGITDAEKAAWDAYVTGVNTSLKSLQVMRETVMPMRGKTSVEQFDAHVTAIEDRLKALKDLKPTLTALYASLNENQKRKADDTLLGMSCMI